MPGIGRHTHTYERIVNIAAAAAQNYSYENLCARDGATDGRARERHWQMYNEWRARSVIWVTKPSANYAALVI